MQPVCQKSPWESAGHCPQLCGTLLRINFYYSADQVWWRKERTRTARSMADVAVGRLPSQQLNDCTAERPNVGSCRRAPERDNFRCCPVGCTGVSAVLDLMQVEREPEVSEFYASIFCHEDIRRLEVAVHDVIMVEVIQPLEDFYRISCYPPLA